MKKNYCIFAAHYLPHTGGVERYTYNLARELAARGNQVTVVTSNTEHLKFYEKLEGIRVFRIPCYVFLNGRFPVLKPDRRFWNIHRRIFQKKYDLIIVNTRFYFHSLYGMLAAGKQRTRCITIDHGTGHMLTGSSLLDKIGEVYEHVITMLEKRVCTEFYGVSKAAAKWLAHFGIRARGVLYNSIDIEQIDRLYADPAENFRQRCRVSEETVAVTYAGRLVKEKGILNLIQVMEELHETYPSICLFIAGDGELMEEVKKRENDFIRPLGRLPFEQVIALLRQTDIFCLPSDYPEGFPTSTLEAMACRCYPVVTGRGGAKELIPDASYGCVIANGQKEILKPALEKAILNPAERKQASEKGCQRVREYFTWERVADQIEKICRTGSCKPGSR